MAFLAFIFVAWSFLCGYDWPLAILGGLGMVAFFWKIGTFDWFLEP